MGSTQPFLLSSHVLPLETLVDSHTQPPPYMIHNAASCRHQDCLRDHLQLHDHTYSLPIILHPSEHSSSEHFNLPCYNKKIKNHVLDGHCTGDGNILGWQPMDGSKQIRKTIYRYSTCMTTLLLNLCAI